MMILKKLMIALVLAGATALPVTSANAFWGGWMPWDWFDDDYYGGPWGGYPGYYGYPGWGGYPGGYYGYPGYGWGGYPAYGYPGYYGW